MTGDDRIRRSEVLDILAEELLVVRARKRGREAERALARAAGVFLGRRSLNNEGADTVAELLAKRARGMAQAKADRITQVLREEAER